MANSAFNDAILRGQVNWETDDFSMIICDATYTNFNNDQVLSDVPLSARFGTPAPLLNKQITWPSQGGENFLIADDTISFGIIPGGTTLDRCILYQDTGDEATSILCGELRSFSVSGLPYLTNGTVVDLQFQTFFTGAVAGQGLIFQFST